MLVKQLTKFKLKLVWKHPDIEYNLVKRFLQCTQKDSIFFYHFCRNLVPDSVYFRISSSRQNVVLAKTWALQDVARLLLDISMRFGCFCSQCDWEWQTSVRIRVFFYPCIKSANPVVFNKLHYVFLRFLTFLSKRITDRRSLVLHPPL